MMTILILFQGGSSLILNLLPFVAILGIFYFLVILPQKRQKQQIQDMIENLKMGDEIVTNGGIIGKIIEVRKSSFIIRSAENSNLEVGKAAVVGKRHEEEIK